MHMHACMYVCVHVCDAAGRVRAKLCGKCLLVRYVCMHMYVCMSKMLVSDVCMYACVYVCMYAEKAC